MTTEKTNNASEKTDGQTSKTKTVATKKTVSVKKQSAPADLAPAASAKTATKQAASEKNMSQKPHKSLPEQQMKSEMSDGKQPSTKQSKTTDNKRTAEKKSETNKGDIPQKKPSGSSAKKSSGAPAKKGASGKSGTSKDEASATHQNLHDMSREELTGIPEMPYRTPVAVQSVKVLTQVYQGAQAGLQAIGSLIPKTEDEQFKQSLTLVYTVYDEMSSSSASEILRLGEKPREKNAFSKAMLWGSLTASTLVSTTPSNLADMMIKNSTANINGLTRALHRHPEAEEHARSLAGRMIQLEEKSMQDMKRYL